MSGVVERDTIVRGVRLHWAECGAGEPVVLMVHGLGASLAKWLDAMPHLAAGSRAVALDLPGFGRSDVPRARFTPAFLAGGVRAFMDEVGIERAVLVGNSLGGLVSMWAAAAWPARVRGLALVAPALPAPPGGRHDPRVLARFTAPLVPGVGEALYRAWLARRTPEQIVAESLSYNVADPARVSAATLARLEEEAADRRRRPELGRAMLSAQRSLAWLLAAGREQVARVAERLAVPTLLVWGSEDRMVPPAVGEHWVGRIPGAELVVMEGAGHNPQIEHPEHFARIVLAFAARLTAPLASTGA